MTNTTIIEECKFGRNIVSNCEKMIRKGEKRKLFVMRKDEKMKKGSCGKKSIKVE